MSSSINMKIFEVSEEQLPIVRELAHEIWPVAYGSILSVNQLGYMLEKFYSIPALENLMENRNQVFLLIQENHENLGFASYELNCGNSGKTKLHKIYVRTDIQGKGVGKLLLDEIENIAKQNRQKALFLNVNRFNNARYFYEKLGYKITETVDIEIGNGYLMEDYVMEKQL